MHIQGVDIVDQTTGKDCTSIGGALQPNFNTGYYSTPCIPSEGMTAKWNYGANFGGPTKSTWTSGANSLTGGVDGNKTGQGMFGKFGVVDTSYSRDDGGQPNFRNPQVVTMCAGTAGSVCRG